MAESTCIVDGCEKPRRYVTGWCPMHYQRMRNYGSTDLPPKRPRAKCPCGEPVRCKGLCKVCYRRSIYLENYEEERLARLAYYAEHADDLRARSAKWRREHPLRRREAQQRRKRRMTNPVNYAAILAEHGMFCHICSMVIVDLSDLHFDHVIPLSKGGPHDEANIRPAHALCNIRKGAKIA